METRINQTDMKPKKIIGFTSGYFDVMHKGHVMMLHECKRHCDYLIVGVHSNKIKICVTSMYDKNDSIPCETEYIGFNVTVNSTGQLPDPSYYNEKQEVQICVKKCLNSEDFVYDENTKQPQCESGEKPHVKLITSTDTYGPLFSNS